MYSLTDIDDGVGIPSSYCTLSGIRVSVRGGVAQGAGQQAQPAEMLRMQQELTAAHKLVAHLKIELDAAHGQLNIFR